MAQFRKDPVITIPLSDESGQFIMLTPDIATLVTEGIIHQEYNQEKGEGYLLLTDQGRSLALHVVITHKIKKLTP